MRKPQEPVGWGIIENKLQLNPRINPVLSQYNLDFKVVIFVRPFDHNMRSAWS